MFNLRTFTALALFHLTSVVSARATALDSPSSQQVREACSTFTQTIGLEVMGTILLLVLIGVVRYMAYRMARD